MNADVHSAVPLSAGTTTPGTQAPCLDLVARLRNGGQTDLADMAERRDKVLRRIFYACQWEQLCPGTFNFAKCEQDIREAMK